VWVTHGYREPVVRWLREHGLRAQSVASRWEGETDEADVVVEEGETNVPPVEAKERPDPAKLDTIDGPEAFG
jgi:Holliday junction resolvase-like predicted endonuclease